MKRLSESVKFRIGRQYGNPSIPIGKPFDDLMPGDIFNYIALLCSAIVAVLGVLVMAGWVTGIHSLASLGSSSIPQAPASALAFILLGGTWFFYLLKPSRRLARMGVLASALIVLFVALLNLIRFFTGVNAIIEELLISKILVLDPGIYGADPMSPITAASFFLSCAAMILLLKHERRKEGLSGGLASIATLVNLVVLLGYLYGTPLLYGGEIRPVSLPTGISFVFLSAGLIATAGPGHFPLRLLVGPSMRALLLRYFLLVILIFVLAHAVIYNLFSQLIINVALRTALAVLVAVVVNSAVVLQLSRVIGGTIESEETERKLVEKALLESEEKFRSIVEQSGDGIVLTDEQGIIIEWNKAEEQIIGMKRSEVVGRPIWDVQFQMSPLEKKNPEAYEKLKANMLELIMTGRSQWLNRLWENDIQRPDGTRRSVQVLIFLIRTSKGWQVGSISRDITDRKQAEESIKKYAKELEESNRMKELFIDIMHHDLLNPLTAASGYIELLQEEQIYLKKNVYLEGVEKSLVRAHELIENATMFSKLRSLESIDFEDMELKEVIGRVVENLAPLVSRAGMIIENNITRTMQVSGNKMIEEVFANLISNAVKYAPKGKRIIIDSMDTDEFWRIQVIDFGEGISDADKPRIFDRFLRIEKKGVKGSGLGLAIAERIVELHKGRIWVEDNPEGGAVFVVEIPKFLK